MNGGDDSRSLITAPSRGGRSMVPVADVTNAFGSVFSAVVLALVAAFLVASDIRPWMADRDGLIFWMIAVAYAIAFVVGVWAYRRSSHEGGFRLVIPLTAAILLGQHLRWGAEALSLPLPSISGVEVGSLIDLRDVVSLNAERLGLGALTGAAVLAVILGATAAAASWAKRWADDRVLITEAPVVMWFVAAIGCAAAIPAVGIFGESDWAWLATGMAGLLSSGFLVMSALAAGDHRRTVAGWRRRIWPWIADEGSLARIPSDRA